MPETLDLDALTAAAAEAAGHDDAATAVRFLRRALDLQIASFGPDHRELAPTLNNLALMLERQGQANEAERCYRRAYDIAKRGARPNDPLVQVSRANLLAFLQATGVANPMLDEPAAGLETPRAPEPAADAPLRPSAPPPPPAAKASSPTARPASPRVPAERRTGAAQPTAPPPPRVARSAQRSASLPPVAPEPGRGGLFWWLALAGTAAGALAAWLFLSPSPASRSGPQTATAAQTEPQVAQSAPERTEPQAASPPAEPPAQTAPSNAAPPAEPAPGRTDPLAAAPPAADGAPDPRTDGLSADGRLCSALIRTSREWRCDAVGSTVDTDAVYYYTRVRTPREVVMRHRWTYEGQVIRTVNLEVRANAEAGFRTFSRQTVSGRGSGAWEVALIAPDGAVIDTQRFTVAE
jgi:hypothetical protein